VDEERRRKGRGDKAEDLLISEVRDGVVRSSGVEKGVHNLVEEAAERHTQARQEGRKKKAKEQKQEEQSKGRQRRKRLPSRDGEDGAELGVDA
jgi:hypothetical protein